MLALLRARRRLEILPQGAGLVSGTATLRKAQDLEHPHGAIERDRYHVLGTHGAARRVDLLAVDANVAGGGEQGRRRTRTHHPGMPQPLVYALAIQIARASARFLCVRLELLL